MTRLGTEEKPAVIRVQTLERSEEMTALCNEHGWRFIIGIEPDKREDISDVEKLLVSQSAPMKMQKVGRNDPCPCGSDRKYKKCCIDKEIAATDTQYGEEFNQGMESLYSKLPELAEKETRMVIVMHENKQLPPGEYAMLESYCNDKKCDCRRVFINVECTGKILATIGYGWEDIKFYEKWAGDSDIAKDAKGPILELGGVYTNMSNDILKFFKEIMLMDETFLNRLRSHYAAFKSSLQDGV